MRYILSGSLRRADKRLRIAVELIDAATETALWSDRFNLELEDLFDLQDEIAGAVASRLSSQIDIAEQRQESPHPRDMRAYGLVVRGRHLILKFTKEANWHARRLFEEAIEFAPEYGRAFSALSRTHNLDWRYAWSATPQDSLELAIVLARRAKEFDRLDAHGFAELGYAKLYSKQLEEALVEYAQAMALNPNDSDIIAEYADALVYAEQPQRSVELLEKAMRLNPFYPDWYLWYLADAYDALGRSKTSLRRFSACTILPRADAFSHRLCPSRDDAARRKPRRGRSCGFIPNSPSVSGFSARHSRPARPRALCGRPAQGRLAGVTARRFASLF